MPKETKFNIEGVACPVQRTLSVIGDKWTVLILHQLMDRGTLRFGELRKVLPGITQKVLTKQLRALELDGLIKRTVYAEVPPRVEYTLTDLGASLEHVFKCMAHWGDENADRVAMNRRNAIMGITPSSDSLIVRPSEAKPAPANGKSVAPAVKKELVGAKS